MFERFTDQARHVVVVAHQESAKLGHDHIGTEHLLLGILGAGDSVAVSALAAVGVSQVAARRQVEELTGRGSHQHSGHIPFTPRAKTVLELSLREALRLGHDSIEPEHILLGLISEGDGVGAQALTRLSADLKRIRLEVIALLPGRPVSTAAAPVGAGGSVDAPGRAAGVFTRPRRPDPAGLDAIRDRLDAITGQLAAIVTKLGIGGETGWDVVPDPEPTPEALRELDRQVEQIRAAKEAAIDAQDFERAVTLRNSERELRARRDAERELWLAATEHRRSAISASTAELDRLRGVIRTLRAQLRRHGIEPEAE
jgi:ATP-dependent Clp protease ATP-binding subunit ClpA